MTEAATPRLAAMHTEAIGDHRRVRALTAAPEFHTARESVVVVAAERFTRDGVSAIVEDRLDVVGSATTLAEAIELVGRWQPTFCVVVLGPPLPDASIEETCASLAAHCAETAAVAVFRSADHRSLAAARRHGIKGFLDTSATADELYDALDRVKQGDIAVQPSLIGPLVETARREEEPSGGLSDAQIRTLELLAEGLSSKEIARRVGTTTAAVNHLIERATRRLDATHRTHAVARAIRLGLID